MEKNNKNASETMQEQKQRFDTETMYKQMYKIDELQGKIADLEMENTSLKRRIGGYKTAKSTYEKQYFVFKEQIDLLTSAMADSSEQIKTLQQELEDAKSCAEHYKQLDKEGDELNEKRIAEIETLKTQNEKREKELQSAKVEIQSLKEVNTTLSRQIVQLEDSLNEALVQRDDYRTNYETIMSLPWYKRIFMFL